MRVAFLLHWEWEYIKKKKGGGKERGGGERNLSPSPSFPSVVESAAVCP